ncbi:hypothetical protein FGG08_000019 [Glutinoglossum americanum]|uniref:ATP-dependent RNA helicase SUV3, mitochondrial n=1 Tax=Glutinoglossum americanum TaxID=1670608 RepID=A0A9P8IE14_9PEZI|nr:hypothetical protein FGG08_000019 [Glutinoglossum americanum]
MVSVENGLGQCLLCAFRTQRLNWSTSRQISKRGFGREASKLLGGQHRGVRKVPSGAKGRGERASIGPRYHPPQFQKLSPAVRGRIEPSKVRLIIETRLDILRDSLGEAWSDRSRFETYFAKFKTSVKLDPGYFRIIPTASVKDRARTIWDSKNEDVPNTLYDFKAFQRAYVDGGVKGLDLELKHAFLGFVADSETTERLFDKQEKISDFRYPIDWYPATKAIKRSFHLHVGPTNSGKTYHALQRLEQAKTGIYAAPLRLLAHEIYTRLNAKGKPCNLITGEERRVIEGEKNPMISCTVEMTPIDMDLEVAVIDEIQMIGSSDRGWAWSQALLGVRAREVHLCGEERVVPLIRQLTSWMGESLKIHRYTRLSPLVVEDTSLRGDLHSLRKGDCVVVFSRSGIHDMKEKIETITGKRCAVVYGSLPPETRAQQARLFNDPDSDYDILVASDAIGMGLNLSIKRIIFDTTLKFSGQSLERLTTSEIKQIAGRAGRYRTAQDGIVGSSSTISGRGNEALIQAKSSTLSQSNIGIVTTLEDFDLQAVRNATARETEPIASAGILAPASVVHKFVSCTPPGTPFSFILRRLYEISRINPRFHLCELGDQLLIAELIEPIKGLSVVDRINICKAPADRTPRIQAILRELATCIARRSGGALSDIKEMPLDLLGRPASADKSYLESLEELHKGLSLYLWLSYRFEGVFPSRPQAFGYKEIVEKNIEKVLGNMSCDLSVKERKLQVAIKQIKVGYRDLLKQIAQPKPEIPILPRDKSPQRLTEGGA